MAPKETQSSVENEWQNIRNLLVNDGATVVPYPTSEDDPAKFEAELEAAVRKSDLFVQLFSALDSLVPARSQIKRVGAVKPIPILQWRKKIPNLKLDLAILKELPEEDRSFCEGATVQTGLLEDFKLAIRDRLEELNKSEAIVKVQIGSPRREKPYLYITADTSDLCFARPLQAAARKHTVAVVMEEEEAHRREDFEQGLMQATGVVFLYGNATRQFVNHWLNAFVRKTAGSKVNPVLAEKTWLYWAPPTKTAEQEPLEPIEMRKEGSQTEFSLDGIERICAELCGDRA